ncbi:MAG: hypothetical protein OEY20_01600 [Gemmatimonadota bacterium]|nr:hypothetical protein [Gemmatimonadota bacterium]MDH4352011.1 hypothetical protein [Gemmatimonadota bacterium]MDH5195927.1 hypothetical protein [Gemmatimonadota bacterium]
MSFRQSPEQTKAARAWAAFVAANDTRLQAAGLPTLAAASVEHWDDLLRHGRFTDHPDSTQFEITQLTDDQYAVFTDLVESYFLAGYEYFTPGALKREDQERLGTRFDR